QRSGKFPTPVAEPVFTLFPQLGGASFRRPSRAGATLLPQWEECSIRLTHRNRRGEIMLWLRRLMLTLPWIRRRREQVLDEELHSYIEMASEAARDEGTAEEDAFFAAKRDLGS